MIWPWPPQPPTTHPPGGAQWIASGSPLPTHPPTTLGRKTCRHPIRHDHLSNSLGGEPPPCLRLAMCILPLTKSGKHYSIVYQSTQVNGMQCTIVMLTFGNIYRCRKFTVKAHPHKSTNSPQIFIVMQNEQHVIQFNMIT